MSSPDTGSGRHETVEERNDRNLADLLQELRVAGLGVQVLFGFLLSLPFTVRFSNLDGSQRGLYIASLLLAALSTALLCAPVAYHRLVFRRHQKERLLRTANLLALLGLASVGCAITTAVLLVVSVVDRGAAVAVLAGVTAATFAGLWFVLPLIGRSVDGGPPTTTGSSRPPDRAPEADRHGADPNVWPPARTRVTGGPIGVALGPNLPRLPLGDALDAGP